MTAVTLRVDSPGIGQLVVLLEDELVIGRDCEGLLLADPQVSRRHLRLRRAGHAVEVADLNSTNGSRLNSVPLDHPVLVETTSRVSIGDTVVTIELDEEPATGGRPKIGATTTLRGADDLRATSIDIVADAVASEDNEVSAGAQFGGTITIVFSDIEASTERATEMGDRQWYDVLEHHNRIIRAVLRDFAGREVKSIGDGFMLAFSGVHRALRFATELQRRIEAPDGPDLRVRIGLHTGEAIEDAGGDLFGRHVNLAARVANLAGGGQIVASLVVREIAAGHDEPRFGEPQQVQLKGFAEPQTVYEVLWDA